MEDSQENRHSSTTKRGCQEMGKRNGWKLKRVERKQKPILKYDCVFEGEQTSFEDQRYD